MSFFSSLYHNISYDTVMHHNVLNCDTSGLLTLRLILICRRSKPVFQLWVKEQFTLVFQKRGQHCFLHVVIIMIHGADNLVNFTYAYITTIMKPCPGAVLKPSISVPNMYSVKLCSGVRKLQLDARQLTANRVAHIHVLQTVMETLHVAYKHSFQWGNKCLMVTENVTIGVKKSLFHSYFHNPKSPFSINLIVQSVIHGYAILEHLQYVHRSLTAFVQSMTRTPQICK